MPIFLFSIVFVTEFILEDAFEPYGSAMNSWHEMLINSRLLASLWTWHKSEVTTSNHTWPLYLNAVLYVYVFVRLLSPDSSTGGVDTIENLVLNVGLV